MSESGREWPLVNGRNAILKRLDDGQPVVALGGRRRSMLLGARER